MFMNNSYLNIIGFPKFILTPSQVFLKQIHKTQLMHQTRFTRIIGLLCVVVEFLQLRRLVPYVYDMPFIMVWDVLCTSNDAHNDIASMDAINRYSHKLSFVLLN